LPHDSIRTGSNDRRTKLQICRAFCRNTLMSRQNQKEYRVYFPDQEAEGLDAIAAQAGIRTTELIRQRVRAFDAAPLPHPAENSSVNSAAPAANDPHSASDALLLRSWLEASIAALVEEQQQTRMEMTQLLTENQALRTTLDQVQQQLPNLSLMVALASLTRREVESLILAIEHILLDVAPPEEKVQRQAMSDSIRQKLTNLAAQLGLESDQPSSPKE
jgi:AraC-like DNA-binding protein